MIDHRLREVVAVVAYLVFLRPLLCAEWKNAALGCLIHQIEYKNDKEKKGKKAMRVNLSEL